MRRGTFAPPLPVPSWNWQSSGMHESGDIAIITGRVRILSYRLQEMPGQSAEADEAAKCFIPGFDMRLPDGNSAGREIELRDIATRLQGIPDGADVLEAI